MVVLLNRRVNRYSAVNEFITCGDLTGSGGVVCERRLPMEDEPPQTEKSTVGRTGVRNKPKRLSD